MCIPMILRAFNERERLLLQIGFDTNAPLNLKLFYLFDNQYSQIKYFQKEFF